MKSQDIRNQFYRIIQTALKVSIFMPEVSKEKKKKKKKKKKYW